MLNLRVSRARGLTLSSPSPSSPETLENAFLTATHPPPDDITPLTNDFFTFTNQSLPYPTPTLARLPNFISFDNTLKMPQNEHIELHQKRHGVRMDAAERQRKREARQAHRISKFAQKVHGLRAKLYNQKRFKEKAAMKKKINMHQERDNKHAKEDEVEKGAVPAYLLDREGVTRAKVLSNTVKQKRKEKAGKWDVPLPKVRAIADEEMFKVIKTGKRKKKSWKRMITKVTFVGEQVGLRRESGRSR